MAKLPTNIQPQVGQINDEPMHFVQNGSFTPDQYLGISSHAVYQFRRRTDQMHLSKAEALEILRRIYSECIPFAKQEAMWHDSGLVLVQNEDGTVVTILGPCLAKKHVGRRLVDGTRSVMKCEECQGDG